MTNRLISLLTTAKLSNRKLSAEDISIVLNISNRSIRFLVEQIRREDLVDGYVLVSSDEGYYLSNDSKEIERFLSRYLSAAYSVIKTAKQCKKFLNEKQVGQIQGELIF